MRAFSWAVVLVAGALACSNKSGDDPAGVGADEADADTDADTDADSDADSDADTDADSDADTDADSDADTDADTDADPQLSHAADIQPIWQSRCSGCHISGSSGNLSLTDGSTMVNRRSTQATSLDLVEPGDPGASYVYLKITNNHTAAGGTGTAMPPSGGVEVSEIQLVEEWIRQGAAP